MLCYYCSEKIKGTKIKDIFLAIYNSATRYLAATHLLFDLPMANYFQAAGVTASYACQYTQSVRIIFPTAKYIL